jgi:hypothetical protein
MLRHCALRQLKQPASDESRQIERYGDLGGCTVHGPLRANRKTRRMPPIRQLRSRDSPVDRCPSHCKRPKSPLQECGRSVRIVNPDKGPSTRIVASILRVARDTPRVGVCTSTAPGMIRCRRRTRRRHRPGAGVEWLWLDREVPLTAVVCGAPKPMRNLTTLPGSTDDQEGIWWLPRAKSVCWCAGVFDRQWGAGDTHRWNQFRFGRLRRNIGRADASFMQTPRPRASL